jgi:hypothetical protein
MEPEGSLLHLQVLDTCPYPENSDNFTYVNERVLAGFIKFRSFISGMTTLL